MLRDVAVASLVAAAAAFACACGSKPGAQRVAPPDAGPDAAAAPAPASLGPVFDAQAVLTIGLYFTPSPKIDPKDALARTCAEQAKPFTRAQTLAELLDAKGWAFTARRDDTPPPDADALHYIGEGLSPGQIAAVQKSERSAQLILVAPAAERWKSLRAAYELVDCLAEATGGLIYDVDSRQLFTRAAFEKARLGRWDDGRTMLAPHFSTHVYQNGDYLRAVTVGLGRFGLPELVVNDFIRSEGDSASMLINLLAETLERSGTLEGGAFVDVDLDAPWSPTHGVELGRGAQRKARFRLQPSEHEQGDNVGRQWEVSFEGFPGADLHERQSAAFHQLFGTDDKIMAAKKGDEELAAASRRARARLPGLRKHFAAGLAPGERLLLKAPFHAEGGTEYMWIEVGRWKGEEIQGVLDNEPDHIPDLHKGATVKVQQEDVYDFSFVRADGKIEGGETDRLLEQRQ